MNVVFLPPKPEPQPGPDCVCVIPTDGKPVKWFKFYCSFQCEDGEFAFSIWALNQADAERRMEQLRKTAKVEGQIYTSVPV